MCLAREGLKLLMFVVSKLGRVIQPVSEIMLKATKTLGFLCQNLALASKGTKSPEQKTQVHPQLEYAAPPW